MNQSNGAKVEEGGLEGQVGGGTPPSSPGGNQEEYDAHFVSEHLKLFREWYEQGNKEDPDLISYRLDTIIKDDEEGPANFENSIETLVKMFGFFAGLIHNHTQKTKNNEPFTFYQQWLRAKINEDPDNYVRVSAIVVRDLFRPILTGVGDLDVGRDSPIDSLYALIFPIYGERAAEVVGDG